jgi:hypothetical protein
VSGWLHTCVFERVEPTCRRRAQLTTTTTTNRKEHARTHERTHVRTHCGELGGRLPGSQVAHLKVEAVQACLVSGQLLGVPTTARAEQLSVLVVDLAVALAARTAHVHGAAAGHDQPDVTGHPHMDTCQKFHAHLAKFSSLVAPLSLSSRKVSGTQGVCPGVQRVSTECKGGVVQLATHAT